MPNNQGSLNCFDQQIAVTITPSPVASDVGQLKPLLIDKAGVGSAPERITGDALKDAIALPSRKTPFVVMFRGVFLSINNGITFDKPINDVAALSIKLTQPDNSTLPLVTIRAHEAWPGGRPSGVNFIGRDGVATFTQKGTYTLSIDTEYSLFNLFVGQFAYGSIIGLFVNNTAVAAQPWIPSGVTQNGVPVHEKITFNFP